jgi:hypothetical protein
MFWLNALTVQMVTDIYQKSFMFVLTEAARSSERWDARMLAGQKYFEAPSTYTVASPEALRAQRVQIATHELDRVVCGAKQVLSAKIGLASGGTGGFVGIPTRTTSKAGKDEGAGLPLGGRVLLESSYVEGTNNLVAAGPTFVIGSTSDYLFSSNAAERYQIIYVDVDIDSVSDAYYGCLTLIIDGAVKMVDAPVVGAITPTAVPGDAGTTVVPRQVYLESYSAFWPNGSRVEHSFGGSSLNRLSEVLSFNYIGSRSPQIRLKILIYGSGDVDSTKLMEFKLNIRHQMQNYVLDGDRVPVASLTEIKTVEGTRYDDILGSGYTGIGPIGSSLGSACGWPIEGTAMTKRLFQSVNEAPEEVSFVGKYSKFNPEINTLEKFTCPPFWSIVPWSGSENVRKSFSNFVGDSTMVKSLVSGSETVSNLFQTRVFGAPVAF